MAPVDELKSKLQMQAVQATGKKLYSGPIDVAKQLIQQKGPLAPWRNYPLAAAHRSFIGLLFLSYEVQMRAWHALPDSSPWKVSESLATFIAGGVGSNIFWFSSYPIDAVKKYVGDSRCSDRGLELTSGSSRAQSNDVGLNQQSSVSYME